RPRLRHVGLRAQRRRQLVAGRPGERRGFHLAARHLPGELFWITRGLPRDKNRRGLTLPRQRDIARRLPPMLGVVEIGVVEGLALAFVDRAGIAVPKTVELRRRPDDLAPRRPLGSIESRV